MSVRMSLTDDEWTLAAVIAGYEDDPALAPIARDLADTETAWLMNHTPERIPGWTYRDGVFTGPYDPKALRKVLDLRVEAVDYTLGCADEILRDAAESAR